MMPTYRMLYGEDQQLLEMTYDDVTVQREDGWTVLFRGDQAILRVQDQHVRSLERIDEPSDGGDQPPVL